ncbi:MAG TPA: DUF116 domain-containing protein, partial [Edaphobacter sp.]|nr:DUF116 domain-containing protein [Edaphobacter sp.]
MASEPFEKVALRTASITQELEGPLEDSGDALVPYCLPSDESASDAFYQELSRVSELILEQAEQLNGELLDRYEEYRRSAGQAVKSRSEATTELLIFGTMTALFTAASKKTPEWVLSAVQRLWPLGNPGSFTASLTGAAIKTLSRFNLAPPRVRSHHSGNGERFVADVHPSAEEVWATLPHLIRWLQCTGEYAQEAKRLVALKVFFDTVPETERIQGIERIQELFAWFSQTCHETLGAYTTGALPFAQESSAGSFRNDRFLRAKNSVEYHLALVATQLANQEMLDGFERTWRKVVLLPTCMRGRNAQVCRGDGPCASDVICAKCDAGCGISGVSTLCENLGVEAYVENCLGDPTRLYSRWAHERRTTFVAVGCLGNLLRVQLRMRDLGMIFQCVPLEYPGCHS